MNKISLYVDEYENENIMTKDGINFMNVQTVKLLIDGRDIEEDKNFTDAMIYWYDLSLSYYKTGKYLIFTCACGIADDGGWAGVDITVDDNYIHWDLEVESIFYSYKFNKQKYIEEIKSIEKFLKLQTSLTLEPTTIVYPDNWVNSN